MSAGAVDAALERLGRRDRELGQSAEVAAGALMAGEGTEMLSQATVQEFVWWHLPRQFPPGYWSEVAEGAAALLDELGLDRYAATVRSDVTAQVLSAWDTSAKAGSRAAAAASRSSGVEPPDTELIAWGDVYGAEEEAARSTVERALEEAIAAGRFTPGRKGWKLRAAEVCDEIMSTPTEENLGQTPLGLVITERVQTWISAARHDTHRDWCQQVAKQILGPVEPPEGAEAVVAPLRWLLERTVGGVTLTQSGYLPRELVVEADERFGWERVGKPPRSEADVPHLQELRAAATRLRLVRRRGRTLSATARARRALDDTAVLWDLLGTSLGEDDDLARTVAELMGLRLVVDGPAHGNHDRLARDVGPIVVAQGWRTPDGPLDPRQVSSTVHHLLFWWRVLGLLDEASPTWDADAQRRTGEHVKDLTPAGHATVLAYLRHRAVRPRQSIYEL